MTSDQENALFVAQAARFCKSCLRKGYSCKFCPAQGSERLVDDRKIEVEGGLVHAISEGRKSFILAVSKLCRFGFNRSETNAITVSRKMRGDHLSELIRRGYLEISSEDFIRFTPLGLELVNDTEKHLAVRSGEEPGAET